MLWYKTSRHLNKLIAQVNAIYGNNNEKFISWGKKISKNILINFKQDSAL